LCYDDADLGGETDTSKYTFGMVIYALETPLIWKTKKQIGVAQSTMQAEMIATASGKVQIDWLSDLVSQIAIRRGITRRILNDRLNSITTLNSGSFQSDSRHLRLRYHSIHDAIVKVNIDINHVAGTEMLADALTKALRGVKIGEIEEEIGLGYDHGQDFGISFLSDSVFGFPLCILDSG
jgi:hypothetical protein